MIVFLMSHYNIFATTKLFCIEFVISLSKKLSLEFYWQFKQFVDI